MNPQGTFQLPPQLSTLAPDVDWVYYFIYWISVAFFVAICGVMIYYVIRYRRRPGVKAVPTGHNTPLEVFWTFTPLILLFFLFQWGFDGYMKGIVAPPNALEFRVHGQQWKWSFQYPSGGQYQPDEVWVPVNRPVKFIMSSKDVIHSFFVPAFRLKRDVVPGMYSTLWFQATHTGDVQVFCSQYCGSPTSEPAECATNPRACNVGHSAMLAKIHVVTYAQYEKKATELATAGQKPPPECAHAPNANVCWGEALRTKQGCNACHGVDGVQQQPAPNWKGLYGSQVHLANGETVTADDNYIRESILSPQAKIVGGYTTVTMPPFRLTDEQIEALIDYMKSLK